jgi:hypothetical protein
VVISILLASVIVTSVMSVALTSKSLNGQNGRNDRHQVAGQAMKEISSALRNFVTGCCDVATGTCITTAGAAYTCGSIPGPNSANATNTWSFNNYKLSAGNATDSLGNVYALQEGVHSITGIMPSWFENAPYNATVVYTVSAGVAAPSMAPATFPSAAGQTMPRVQVVVNWTEP